MTFVDRNLHHVSRSQGDAVGPAAAHSKRTIDMRSTFNEMSHACRVRDADRED